MDIRHCRFVTDFYGKKDAGHKVITLPNYRNLREDIQSTGSSRKQTNIFRENTVVTCWRELYVTMM